MTLATDKALLKEVTKELWHTVKKLRPELGRDPRLQLVLKALITIGDLPNQIEAAVVVGICAEMEEADGDTDKEMQKEIKGTSLKEQEDQSQESNAGRRVMRRRSAAS